MIGILIETPNGWIVKEKVSEDRERTMNSYGDDVEEYPLHPDDVKLILEERGDYPNMWVGENEIEFEIVERCVDSRAASLEEYEKNHVSFAKMIDETHYILSTKTNRERLKSQLKDDNNWDDIFHDYQMDNYPPFGGPFTDAISLEEWLKNKFHPPVRK